MNKLYVGKLSRDVTEDELRKLFEDNDIPVQEILMKKNGFAFVDVSNEELVEKATEKLNGYHLQGGHIKVEPSVPRKARSQMENGSTGNQGLKIIIMNVPTKVEHKEIEKLATTFGTVTLFEASPSKNDSGTYAVVVTYELPEQAEQAIRQLNNFEYQESKLRVKFKNGGRGGPGGRFNNRNQGGPGGMYHQQQNVPDTSNFPVRILVRSEFVGAIIGKGGNNIRAITKETGCKVDIHRKDNIGSSEKVQAVTICGEPQQVTETIKKIVEVMIKESSEESHTDMPLKVLAHNALVGRLIGKSGSSINSIMEDSKAKVTVSLIQDLTVFNPERTVTIYGTPEQCIAAEALISKKLRKAYESYIQNLQPQQHDLFPGLNHMSLMSGGMHHPGQQGPPGPHYGGHGGPGGPFDGGPHYPNQPPMNMPHGGPQQGGGGGGGMNQEPSETTYLFVPREAVGALIGVGGKNIRNTARASNATIRIAPAGNEDSNERCVKIIGTPESQWRAQFYIYDRIRSEGILGSGEVHLRSEIAVPSQLVGRIIGKRGQRVRELQRVTGARVEVPRRRGDGAGDEGSGTPEPPTESNNQNGNNSGDVVVKLEGHFYANQAAQRRIRQAHQEYVQRQNFQGRPGGRRFYRGGPNNQHGGPNQQQQPQQQQQQQQQQ
ncbi:insulin-like growth factor 2 mRNA-binding protein 1 isoform X3 [Strongylocentrotus purpuratus]|uniref:RRM domain-containing protein n=1 Tax=Strongylocentrotus purpuratus TaxID=7668 RepID=A0A7M7P603_STRPU|nr:insulin-like growth factor 2 mRNA-binding protein 1 isoform X3 [Strongylocentrotus purpuratus]